MKVENMRSSKGNKTPNQFIIESRIGRFFQSYKSTIALIPYSYNNTKPLKDRMPNEKIMLDRDKWDYSVTTGKFRNIFLGEKRAETEKKIKSGEYILTNLN